MKQIPASLLTLVIGVVVTLISLWVGQNHGWLPEQASEQAVLVDDFFDVMVVIATALFLVVQGAILFALFQFRQRQGDTTDGEPIEGNLPLEAFWTAIPAVIVIGLGTYSVYVFQEMGGFNPGLQEANSQGTMVAQAMTEQTSDVGSPLVDHAKTDKHIAGNYGFGASPLKEGNTPDLTVEVKGLQYAWIFTYPDSGIVDGELHVPANQDVLLNISSQDVIHSFWVPQFRLKQDAIPGQATELRFVATKPGTYSVVCAELCGAYHGGMRTQVIVHTPEDFEQWRQSRVAQAPHQGKTVAANPAEMTATDYLAPVSQALNIDTHSLAHLTSEH